MSYICVLSIIHYVITVNGDVSDCIWLIFGIVSEEINIFNPQGKNMFILPYCHFN